MKTLRNIVLLIAALALLGSCASTGSTRVAASDDAGDAGALSNSNEGTGGVSDADTGSADAVVPAEGTRFLTLDDFNSSYSELPGEAIGMDENTFGDSLELYTSEIFINPEAFQVVMNFVFVTDDSLSQSAFTLLSEDPEFFASSFTMGLGDDIQVLKQREISGLGTSGSGMEFLVDLDGANVWMQVAIVRGGAVSAIFLNMYKESTKPDPGIRSLIPLLNKRLNS